MRRLAAGILLTLAVAAPCPAAAAASSSPGFFFRSTDLDGRVIDTRNYRGKILVIDIWASWCEPCRIAAPHFVKLQSKYKGRGVALVGLSADNQETSAIEDVQGFIDEFHITYPVGLMNQETFDKLVDLTGEPPEQFTIPTTILLDREGKLIRMYSGYFEGQELEIENIITSLIEPEKKPESKN